MEIRKFVGIYFDERVEEIFVKDGEDKYEISLSDDGDRRYYGGAKKNGEKIASKWDDAVKLYHALGCAKVAVESTFYYRDHEDDDFDQFEYADTLFQDKIEMARKWLYA